MEQEKFYLGQMLYGYHSHAGIQPCVKGVSICVEYFESSNGGKWVFITPDGESLETRMDTQKEAVVACAKALIEDGYCYDSPEKAMLMSKRWLEMG